MHYRKWLRNLMKDELKGTKGHTKRMLRRHGIKITLDKLVYYTTGGSK